MCSDVPFHEEQVRVVLMLFRSTVVRETYTPSRTHTHRHRSAHTLWSSLRSDCGHGDDDVCIFNADCLYVIDDFDYVDSDDNCSINYHYHIIC